MITEIQQYLAQKTFAEISEINYSSNQIGANLLSIHELDDAEIVIIGCGEMRGQNSESNYSDSPNAIRNEFYESFYWHNHTKIADLGNIVEGATLQDTRAALTSVLDMLHQLHKTVIVIGGSHDLTHSQYKIFEKNKEIIDCTVLDMLIDLDESEEVKHDSFLMELLTTSPNYIRNFSLVGFQSYFTNPTMLQTLDKLHFECYRLGHVRENIENMEPILRTTDLVSVDINVVKHSDAPSNTNTSPNGLHGDEICQLMRYAGMSDKICSIGLYGFDTEKDINNMTAKLMSQMIWYFIDGVTFRKQEATFADADQFLEFNVTINQQYTLFLKSKRTNRWWMQLPNKNFLPCTYEDYLKASRNEIPERWMREIERSMAFGETANEIKNEKTNN